MAWVLTSCVGRGSAWCLLRGCREFCAMALSLGARMVFRWIPSEWISADEPSRRCDPFSSHHGRHIHRDLQAADGFSTCQSGINERIASSTTTSQH
eukprot:7920212-Pyramimonas_sp.AAC.1